MSTIFPVNTFFLSHFHIFLDWIAPTLILDIHIFFPKRSDVFVLPFSNIFYESIINITFVNLWSNFPSTFNKNLSSNLTNQPLEWHWWFRTICILIFFSRSRKRRNDKSQCIDINGCWDSCAAFVWFGIIRVLWLDGDLEGVHAPTHICMHSTQARMLAFKHLKSTRDNDNGFTKVLGKEIREVVVEERRQYIMKKIACG